MMPANKNRKEYLSRRQMLALSGAAGAATLAGCFGGDDDDGGSDILPEQADEIESDAPDNYEEEYAEVVPSGAVNPYQGEHIFNPHHAQWNPGDGQELSYEYLAVYSMAEEEFIPRVAEGWEIDDDLTTTVTIDDEYGWSDGTDVTAGDFETVLRLTGYMGMGLEEFIDPDEGVYTEDDYTLVVEPRDEFTDLDDELWLNLWAEAVLEVSEEQYGRFVEEFEDADEDEYEDIQEDVINFAPQWDETRYSGLFAFTEANEQFADHTPNQHHPAAQDFEFYLRHGEYEGEEGLRAEEVTWEHNAPQLEDLPDIYDEPEVSFSGQTFAILFGANDEYIRDYPEVRQAIAHAVDFEAIVEVTESPITPVDEYSCGIDIAYVESFVEDDVLDAMTSYVDQDTDRAAELLEEVGFEDDDGTWLTPDGEEWSLDFPVGDWFTDHSEMISNDLAEFGIDMDHFTTEMPTWQAETEPDNDFDMTCHLNYGMAREFHAYSDFDEEMNNPTRGLLQDGTGREGIIEEEVEVPPIGEPDSDDTITVNIPDRVSQLATADDEEERLEAGTELAWMHNQLLPAAMVFPWNEHYWVDAANWDFDLESDDWLTSSRVAHYLLENGLEPQ